MSGIVGGIFKGKSSELSRWAFLLGLLVGTKRRESAFLVEPHLGHRWSYLEISLPVGSWEHASIRVETDHCGYGGKEANLLVRPCLDR